MGLGPKIGEILNRADVIDLVQMIAVLVLFLLLLGYVGKPNIPLVVQGVFH